MKTCLWRFVGAPMLVLALALLAGPGCLPDDKADSGKIGDYFDENPYVSGERTEGYRYLRLTPASVEISYVGEVVRFQVDGGTSPYEWEVADEAAGSISPSRPNEALYTVQTVAPNNVMVFDVAGRSGVAAINGGLEPTPLSASAEPSTLAGDGDIAALTATGGSPPYHWTLDDYARGSLDSDTGASVAYTRNRWGDNSVRVTDSAGNSVTVVIQQP